MGARERGALDRVEMEEGSDAGEERRKETSEIRE
jgi:hypothetical protein